MAETILIVDDNEVHMRLFDDLLRVHGYGTVKSVNGMDVNSERI
jgi:two-component system, cell cycle response regulator DivK